MVNISKQLSKIQNKKFNYKNSFEYVFFKKNKYLLKSIPSLRKYLKIYDSFDLICSNILIYTIKNKKKLDFISNDLFSSIYLNNKLTMEDFLKYYHLRIIDLRYFESKSIKIYIPFFPHLINNIYINEPNKLLENPYNKLKDDYEDNLIDSFDIYNVDLFNSNFTKLIKIKDYDHLTAFYDFDFATIYFINDQGRLDYKLTLFDKYLEKYTTSHILNLLPTITDCIYKNDKNALIENLYNNYLISKKIYQKLLK